MANIARMPDGGMDKILLLTFMGSSSGSFALQQHYFLAIA
jgi:hypothetical protein